MYIGWWAIPLLVTIVAYALAAIAFKDRYQSSFIDFTPLDFIFCYGAATLVVLFAWLIYFIFN